MYSAWTHWVIDPLPPVTQDILQACDLGEYYVYNDIFCGLDYLDSDAVESGKIKDYNIVIMFSIDGAQLYCNKKSDC